MPQKHNHKNDITILSVFRPVDPVRQILRDFVSGYGYSLHCYDNIFDALAQMPIMDNPCTTVIAARPEAALFDVAAFDTLVNPNTTHYVLWLEQGRCQTLRQWHRRQAELHIVENLMQFDALLKTFTSAPQQAPQTCLSTPPASDRRRPALRMEPLSKEELNALLGAEL